jgi:S-DNA-T family DNA segregation ATPase FtsK/SpoIIIE
MTDRISREYLEFQSNRIEAVLASHRVQARVEGGAVSPRWIRFELNPAAGTRIATVRNLSEELAVALGSPDVHIARDEAGLAVEMPRPDAEPVQLLALLDGLAAIPPLTACLGLSQDGRPLLIRLPSAEVAHILVAGTTGSGKTELIRSIILGLALTNRQATLQLALIDPKARGLGPLGGLPHLVGPVASNLEAAAEMLQRLVREMERRDAERITFPRIVVVVDEAIDLVMSGGQPVQSLLERLAQRGREAGIHLVLGAQKPSASAVGGLLKSNFPVRLVGKVASAEDARVAAGVGGTNAERLTGRGDFVAVASGQVTRFQAAFVPVGDWPEALKRLARTQGN